MAYFNPVKGYKDYGTFIIHQFKPGMVDEDQYNPQIGDVVTINENGLIVPATSDATVIATGIVFDVDSSAQTGMAVVLLGQGIIETDNVKADSSSQLPAVGDYVEVNGGVWVKAGEDNVPSGVVLAKSGSKYTIYKFI